MNQEFKTEVAKVNTTPIPAFKEAVAVVAVQELVLGKVKVKCNHISDRWEITFLEGERRGKVVICKAAKIKNAVFKTHEAPFGCGGSIYEGTAIGDYVELPEDFKSGDAPSTCGILKFDRNIGGFFGWLPGKRDHRIDSAREMYLLPGCKAKFID